MSDMTDGLRMRVARPSNQQDMFVEHQAPIENDTQHLHVLRHQIHNVVSAKCFFNYDNYAASDVLLMTTLSLHSFMRSSQAESIIAAVS